MNAQPRPDMPLWVDIIISLLETQTLLAGSKNIRNILLESTSQSSRSLYQFISREEAPPSYS